MFGISFPVLADMPRWALLSAMMTDGRPVAGARERVMHLPTFPIAGGCKCGALRYRLEAEPRSIYACHCRDCQREGSGPYSVGLLAWRKDFVLTDGADNTVTFHKTAESGRVVVQHLCASCFTRVWHDPAGAPSIVVIRAGTLDDLSWVEPVVQIWTAAKLPFVTLDPQLPAYERQAPSRDVFYDAWRNRMFQR